MKQKYTVLQESINGETGVIYWVHEFEQFKTFNEAMLCADHNALIILQGQEYSVSQITGDRVVLISNDRINPVMKVFKVVTVDQAKNDLEDWKNSYK